MQNQFQPGENQTPHSAYLPTTQTTAAIETEADIQAALRITERLSEITRRAKRASTQFWTGFLAWCLILGMFDFVGGPILMDYLTENHKGLLLFLVLLLFTPLAALLLGDRVRAKSIPKFDAEDIAKLGGVKAIVPLVTMLNNPIPKKQKQAIHDALTMILPQMKASDAKLLTANFRDMIHLWLSTVGNKRVASPCSDALRIAALKALEQVGNEKDIPVVEMAANRAPETPGGERVQQAAIDCLPMLMARYNAEEAKKNLLRASQAENADPDTLLRPVSGAGQTDGADLLRGANPPDEASGP